MNTYKSDEWDKWMRVALDGDKSAYNNLLTHVKRWLGAYYSKRIGPEHIDDLVQETLMTVHTKRHTYDPTKPFGPWLSAVARYRWIDFLRASKTGLNVELDEETISAPSKHDSVLAKHDLQKLLAKLPEKQAKIITMVKLQEMTIQDVSNETGQSISSIKVTVHRGIKKMMVMIEEKAS
jgi:RNA polymerase sigma-70 factor (ECF subfamily)